MEIDKLNEELKRVLNELRKQDAGEEITDFKDYDDALKKIKERYDKGLAKAYCPNAIEVEFEGQKYQLAVVLGDKTYRKNGMKPHGMAHYLHKHTNPEKDKNASTEQELMQATKDVKIALQDAKRKKNIVLDPFENKLIFTYGKYVYIICLAKDKDELNYLHNIFNPEKKNYLSNQKSKIKRKLQKELPPNYKEQKD